MKAYVGVTDSDWFGFLSKRPDLNEVNFWRPGDTRAFRIISVGEPFLFKAHHPENRVVGGGFFSGFAVLRVSEAWQLFAEANGVSSLTEMRARVARYRRGGLADGDDPPIGCVFVRDVVFFPPSERPPAPADFAPEIVQGKSYEVARAGSYFPDLVDRLVGHHVELDAAEPWSRPGPVFADPRLAPYRLGQRSFQAVVLNAYGGRCAVTGDKIRPVLQAAHIRPVTQGGEHRLDNGLLLRSDIHTLFDRGYVGVDPRLRLQVSPALRTEFGNGEALYRRAGETVAVPGRRVDQPAAQFLEWHMDEVFRAS